jgi:hypothetical protein
MLTFPNMHAVQWVWWVDYDLDVRGIVVRFPAGAIELLFSKISVDVLEKNCPIHLLIQWVKAVLSTG